MTLDFFNVSDEEWYGFYLQDQVKLPYGFHALAGFRYDSATLAFSNSGTFSDEGRADDEAVTPRFRLLWQPLSVQRLTPAQCGQPARQELRRIRRYHIRARLRNAAKLLGIGAGGVLAS